MKKWENEINLWSSMPDGTKVWARHQNGAEWSCMLHPSWDKNYIYVVDDTNADIIKQWYDDMSKVECYDNNSCTWCKTTSTVKELRHNIVDGLKYRIKSDEPTYYYQWEVKSLDGSIVISSFVTDSYAENYKYKEEGYRKIISSKRIWED